MASELYIERVHLALESTRGTAITTPTHSLNLKGMLSPGLEYWEPKESRGEMAAVYSRRIARTGSAWTVEGPADVNYLPVLLNMAVAPLTSPSTPGGATLSRLWSFIRNMVADDLKTATIIWTLDTQPLVSDYCLVDQLTLSNSSVSAEGLWVSITGAGGVPADIATPTPAANIAGELLPGANMSLWIDTSSAIGTTAVTGRLLSVNHVINPGVTYKHVAAGPTASMDYSDSGRDPDAVGLTTTLVMEVPDMVQYDLMLAGTVTKTRVRHNGALIEGALYNYVDVDTYGPLKFGGWGTNQNSNRTATFIIESIKDATLGADYRVAVQNARTTL